MTITTPGHGFQTGDWIEQQLHQPYPRLVRIAAWLCRFDLPLIVRRYQVTAVLDENTYAIEVE